MPIYVYKCKSCNHEKEQLQKLSDEPLKICPECQKPELEKQVTSSQFQLHGTGWYKTDFKHK